MTTTDAIQADECAILQTTGADIAQHFGAALTAGQQQAAVEQ